MSAGTSRSVAKQASMACSCGAPGARAATLMPTLPWTSKFSQPEAGIWVPCMVFSGSFAVLSRRVRAVAVA